MYFYTQQEEDWLREHAPGFVNSLGLATAFNACFGSKRTAPALRKKVNSLLPWFDFGHSGGTQVGQGFSVTAKPVGTEQWKNGYLYVKVSDTPLPKKFTAADWRKCWVAKHRLIWEQAHGKIPKGAIIVFLDGDRSNFSLANLYCTTKKLTTTMIRNGWFSNNPDVTLAALKLCELSRALDAARQNTGNPRSNDRKSW